MTGIVDEMALSNAWLREQRHIPKSPYGKT